jgi:hypothetical protein
MYAMFQTGSSFLRSVDGGAKFDPFATNLLDTCQNWDLTFDVLINPVVPSKLYASCRWLWRATADSPGDWLPLFIPPLAAPSWVVHSAVDTSSGMVFAGLADGRIFAGPQEAAFRRIFTHPNAMFVTDLEVDPHHPERLYATFSPQISSPPIRTDRHCGSVPAPRVYRITRKSDSPIEKTVIAKNISANLPPGLCVNTVAVDPVLDNVVYVGTQKGIYRGAYKGGGKQKLVWSWSPYNFGMPPADVRDLEYQASTHRLIAGTFGRGVFMMPLDPGPAQ